MLKKTSLTIAIAVMLVTPLSYAGGLTNYQCPNNALTCNVTVNEVPSPGSYNVVSIPDEDGVTYGCHLFGTSGGNVILPALGANNEEYYAAAQLTTAGTLSGEIQITAEIEGATFETVKLGYIGATDLTIQGESGDDDDDGTCNIANNKCTWLLKDLAGGIANGDNLMLFYRLEDVTAFPPTHGQVKLTMKIGTVLYDDIMGKGTIVVATCEDPVDVFLTPTNNPYIRVSVKSNSRQFLTKRPAVAGPDPEFLNANEVIFGYFSIKNVAGVKADDGFTDWHLGNDSASDAFDAAHDAANGIITQLAITEGGQFAASLTGNGRVYLDLGTLGPINFDVLSPTDAVLEFTNADLINMTDYSATIGNIPIVIKADGVNAINVPNDPPKAVFTLSYAKKESMKNIIYSPVLLSRYPQDGTSCWVYNVPNSGAKDILNLRVTNDSGVDGIIKGTLYRGGIPIFEDENLLTPLYPGIADPQLEEGKTVRITSGDLEQIAGQTWPGRAIMLITSTVPKLEVLTVLRPKTSPPCGSCNMRPITNISIGAHGNSCQN